MRLKKEFDIEIVDTDYAGMGVGYYNGNKVHVKSAYPGQVIYGRLLSYKKGIGKIQYLNKTKKADYEIEAPCPHFEKCGGCTSLEIPYEKQVEFKEKEVLKLLEPILDKVEYKGFYPSEDNLHYRNKMEYTFLDEVKDGEMTLGMHLKYRRNGVITTDHCKIVSEDFNKILKSTVDYFIKENIDYYRVTKHYGTLRNLIVREGKNTKELMVILVSATDERVKPYEWLEELKKLDLDSELKSVFYVTNDSLSEAVIPEKVELIYGEDHINETLCGLNFKITPFSFFQTNTAGAEKLYNKVLEVAGDIENKHVFDLYCGTGTIGNILAKKAKEVTGVEIVKEAADIANENSRVNGITNAKFIAGDVKEVLESLIERPDLLVVDPPRGGMHPKALENVLKFNSKELIYVSCNPKSFLRDVQIFIDNQSKKGELYIFDNYPNTNHLEIIYKHYF